MQTTGTVPIFPITSLPACPGTVDCKTKHNFLLIQWTKIRSIETYLGKVRNVFIGKVHLLIQALCQTSKATATNYGNFGSQVGSRQDVVGTIHQEFVGVTAHTHKQYSSISRCLSMSYDPN